VQWFLWQVVQGEGQGLQGRVGEVKEEKMEQAVHWLFSRAKFALHFVQVLEDEHS
jgi:hypothetical protein